MSDQKIYVLGRLMKPEILLLVLLTASPPKFSLPQLLRCKLETRKEREKAWGFLIPYEKFVEKNGFGTKHTQLLWSKSDTQQHLIISHSLVPNIRNYDSLINQENSLCAILRIIALHFHISPIDLFIYSCQ